LSINDSSFVNNAAVGSAGAVYMSAETEAVITSCTFAANTANVFGGSIMATAQSILNISTTSFINGQASVGGALQSDADSDVLLKDVFMFNNSALSAGAMSIHGNLFCNDSSFSNNTAQSRGGAVVGMLRVTCYCSTLALLATLVKVSERVSKHA
jgi:hypothetical protein